MFELIIFTMMKPHVEPGWIHMEPVYQSECVRKKAEYEALYALTPGLVSTFTCRRVVEKDDDT